MTCSARSFGSASSSSASRSSSCGVGPARTGAGDRVHLDQPVLDLHQHLRRRADERDLAGLEEEHVRRGVDRPQAAVDGERVAGDIGAEKRCEGTIWKASPAKMYSRARSTAASKSVAGEVAGDRAEHRLAPRSGGRGTGPARRAFSVRQVATARQYGGLGIGVRLERAGGHDRERAPQVVEHHHRPGDQGDQVRQRRGRRAGRRAGARRCAQVVAEVAAPRRRRSPAARAAAAIPTRATASSTAPNGSVASRTRSSPSGRSPPGRRRCRG